MLREQIKKYRDKFEVSLARVAEIDDQMKRYLGTEMSNPGNIPAVGQGKGNHYIIMYNPVNPYPKNIHYLIHVGLYFIHGFVMHVE